MSNKTKLSGLPPPRFGNEFGSPQLDEVRDTSVRFDMSAISDSYRERQKTMSIAIKEIEDTAKANNKRNGKILLSGLECGFNRKLNFTLSL